MPSMVVCPECHSPIILGEHGRTVTRSFRIDEEALAALEGEAAKRKISVNTFLNQQIISFARFDRFFHGIGLSKLPVQSLGDLVNGVPDQRLVEIAVATARDTPRTIILSKYGQVTMETTLEYLQMLSEFANLFGYSETKSPNGKIITLSHRFGPKGSLFYSNFVRILFEQINYDPKIESRANSIDFEINPRKEEPASGRR